MLAVLLTPLGLLLAGQRAADAVTARVLVGQASTAQAVAVQLARSWEQALLTARSTAVRPSLQDGLARGDDELVERGLLSATTGGPFRTIALYDTTGRLHGAAGGAVAPSADPADGEHLGPAVVDGDDGLVEVVEPVRTGGRQVGTLRLQLSLRRLLPPLDELRFGRTGRTSLVDEQGSYLLTADAAFRGRRLSLPSARALAAGHVSGSLRGYSTLLGARLVSTYAPVPGTSLGLFTRQAESEAFADAARLQRQLRVAAAVALLVGLTLLAAAWRQLRRYRERLQARDAEFRRVLRGSRDIVSRYGRDGRLVFVSEAVRDVLGVDPEDRVGRLPLELVHPDDHAVFLAASQRHRTEDTVRREFRMLHADGSSVWVETTSVVDRAPDGRVLGINAVTRDVTERHETQVALAAARDEALQASLSKSVFLASTSHELRTPLNGILGLTEVLLGTDLDDRQRAYARSAHDSGRTLLRLLDDLLDLAKVEAGRMELEQVPFGLQEVLERAVAPFRPLAARSGVALELEVGAGLPPHVCGDPTRLGQVVANLVSNALKFTAEGSVRVLVDGGDGQVRVRVADTGTGIAPEAMARLFEAYAQADASTARHYGGTGLGLAVSRQLAELQGGSLEVASAVGVGSTFTLRVPLPAADAAPADGPRRPGPGGRRLRVLVAEDDVVNQLVARTMLDQLGHDVVLVDDGQAAVDALVADDAYDVVLMDCQMPVLDGVEATRRLREARPDLRVPVFGLSASAMQDDRARGLAAGMDRYLTKPITMEDLEAALADVQVVLPPGVLPRQTAGRVDARPGTSAG